MQRGAYNHYGCDWKVSYQGMASAMPVIEVERFAFRRCDLGSG
ncbi:MAG TPA: hypothetical protein VKB60_03065 [Terriglobales bacterium]|nr:hypothetical protein [Terriglobales bacterium]